VAWAAVLRCCTGQAKTDHGEIDVDQYKRSPRMPSRPHQPDPTTKAVRLMHSSCSCGAQYKSHRATPRHCWPFAPRPDAKHRAESTQPASISSMEGFQTGEMCAAMTTNRILVKHIPHVIQVLMTGIAPLDPASLFASAVAKECRPEHQRQDHEYGADSRPAHNAN
jgi:hypothetical protein